MTRSLLGAVIAALVFHWTGSAEAGQAASYSLVPRSTILQVCRACPEPAGRPETIEGGFTLTPMNLVPGGALDAVTDIRWESPSYAVSGLGVIRTEPGGRMHVDLRVTINGESMQLRATRRQPPRNGRFSVVLATPQESPVGYLLVVTARLELVAATDADLDGVDDVVDNCRAVANAEQIDADQDGVGDVCDRCEGTAAGAIVDAEGCSLEQMCPCDSPREGGTWGRGAYAKCLARGVRDLRRLGMLSRSEATAALRRALQSGCGQTVIAML